MDRRLFLPDPQRTGSPFWNVSAEAIVLGLACAAPWMLGSVAPWSELLLLLGAGLAAILTAVSGRIGVGSRGLTSGPGLALAGLVLLALVQAAPMPGKLLGVLDPSAAALREDLLPSTPETVIGDSLPPIPLPPPTLSESPGATYSSAVRLTAAWLLYQAVVGLGGGYAAFRRFGWVVAVNAALMGLFALIQTLTWNGKLFWLVPVPSAGGWSTGGPFLSHTHLAEYLNLGLGLALGLLLGSGSARLMGRSNRVWAVYLVGVLVLGVVVSHSRGGFLGMLVAGAVALLGLWGRRGRDWAGVAGVLALLAILFLTLGDASPYAKRLGTLLDLGDKGYLVRAEVWKDALRAVRDHPLWGTGLGTFAVSANPYFRSDQGVFWAHAENVYVELLIEGGVVGFGLALAFLAGVALRVRRALAAGPSDSDRALLLGGCAGLAALSAQFVSDFGLYIPGVAVPLLILVAHLCALASRPAPDTSQRSRPGRWTRIVGTVVTVLPAAVVAYHGLREVRAEAAAAWLPVSNGQMPMHKLSDLAPEALESLQAALRRAVEWKPDWADGHLWLGLTELALYRSTADEWLTGSVPDPVERARLSDPLWLVDVVRQGRGSTEALLEQEPVRRHLIPAARCFLEARGRSPVGPLAHAELGALAWLLEPRQPAAAHLRRALRTAGPHPELSLYVAEIAARSGEPAFAIRGWRQTLQFGDAAWMQVADASSASLSPNQILTEVIPADRPHLALLFADRLYTSSADRGHYELFLRWAAERLPTESVLLLAERLRLEAGARAGLGERKWARTRMTAALALEPGRFEWRKTFIEWLLKWGETQEAHNQALIGLQLSPGRLEARELLDRTAESLARGEGDAGPGAR